MPQNFSPRCRCVNAPYLCSSVDDSQLCFSDHIIPRDVVKKQKHLRPWILFKEISKKLSVAATLHVKPGPIVL